MKLLEIITRSELYIKEEDFLKDPFSYTTFDTFVPSLAPFPIPSNYLSQ